MTTTTDAESTQRLRNKVALITGGARGMGETHARAMVSAGASVLIADVLDAEGADVADSLGDRASYTHLDVTNRGEWSRAIARVVDEFGHLDVLVNNAGANFPDGLDEWSPEGFQASLAMNVEGAQRLSVRAREALATSTMPGGASVVNVISMMTYRATTIVPGYSSSKAALLALTRNLALHWVNDGIRVNAVAPGLIDTPMTAPMKPFQEMLDGELAKQIMRRMGTPEEVAAAVLFLSSEASSFTTGTAFAIDGGYLAL